MPANVPEKLKFLNGEIDGLRSRISGLGNQAQYSKLRMLTDIRDDYQKSVEAAARRDQQQGRP